MRWEIVKSLSVAEACAHASVKDWKPFSWMPSTGSERVTIYSLTLYAMLLRVSMVI